ncbi:unnamed protein product [Caenorhabditis bovis]|uniref:G-protein coupled receptors family 1 profile domain-containing protein n=1 Tax=Caenorhabditis bovis TaxID=2654633 RepID=A0A8S1ESY3_9PELO|nr:unnamed protein product [Caenorhabditis bovis]
MKKTNSSLLRDIQYYFLNTTLFELASSISHYMGQCRMVSNRETLAVMCFGPCKNYGTWVCNIFFIFTNTFLVAAIFSVLLSFYYRYQLMKVEIYKKFRHIKNFALFAIIPLSSMFFQIFTETDWDVVRQKTKEDHPFYDFKNYELFGYSNAKKLAAILAQSFIAIGVYVVPIVALFYRRKIINILSLATGRKFSVEYCKYLVTGLTIEAILPFFLYSPAFTYVTYCQMTGVSELSIEYLLAVTGTFTCIIDPILRIYFVLPYRRAFTKLFHKPFDSVVDSLHQHTSSHFPSRKNNNNNNISIVAT